MHGREIVNNAVDLDWDCHFCRGGEANVDGTVEGETNATVKECALVRKMVERGVWYLRRAKGDFEAFVEGGEGEG